MCWSIQAFIMNLAACIYNLKWFKDRTCRCYLDGSFMWSPCLSSPVGREKDTLGNHIFLLFDVTLYEGLGDRSFIGGYSMWIFLDADPGELSLSVLNSPLLALAVCVSLEPRPEGDYL